MQSTQKNRKINIRYTSNDTNEYENIIDVNEQTRQAKLTARNITRGTETVTDIPLLFDISFTKENLKNIAEKNKNLMNIFKQTEEKR